MKKQEITDLSIELLLRYYDNDVSLLLDCVDDDVLWYGPAEGQFLRGRAAMSAAWAAENNPLTFTVDNLKTTTVSSGASLCIVAMTYSVTTHYPSGNDLPINQRLVLTWRARPGRDRRSRYARIVCCDVTNPHPKSPEDAIYPVHFEQVYSGFAAAGGKSERLHFHGVGGAEYYLFSDSILWGDSCAKGLRCMLHLADGSTAEVALSVREIVAAYLALFLRCHASHFINPNYVKSLRRFTVTMLGGAELPVPEKSYTAFKRAMNAFV